MKKQLLLLVALLATASLGYGMQTQKAFNYDNYKSIIYNSGLKAGDRFTITNIPLEGKTEVNTSEYLTDASGKRWAQKIHSEFSGATKKGWSTFKVVAIPSAVQAPASIKAAAAATATQPKLAGPTPKLGLPGAPKPGLTGPSGTTQPQLPGRIAPLVSGPTAITQPGRIPVVTRPAGVSQQQAIPGQIPVTGGIYPITRSEVPGEGIPGRVINVPGQVGVIGRQPIELIKTQEEIIPAPKPQYAERAPRIMPGEAEIITVEQPVLPIGQRASITTPATYPTAFRPSVTGFAPRAASEQGIIGVVPQRPALTSPQVQLAEQKLKAAQLAVEAAEAVAERAKTRDEQAKAKAQLDEATQKVKAAAVDLRAAVSPLRFAIIKKDVAKVQELLSNMTKKNLSEVQTEWDLIFMQEAERNPELREKVKQIEKLLTDKLAELENE